MGTGFISNVLSSKKQRKRFFWFRNVISVFFAFLAYQEVGGTLGWLALALALIVSYFTVAPTIAFVICFIEEMGS